MAKKVKIVGFLFFPLVALYTLAVFFRNWLYDRGVLRPCKLQVRAISVGNIQLGGTGKTPFTEFLARRLGEKGYRVAILTRGYRRKSRDLLVVDEGNRSGISPEQIGDEPYLLLQNLPGVILGVGANRCQVAAEIARRYPEAIFLLDDGFQHRRMPRQLDVVLVDPTRWSSWPCLFPLTTFRDVKSSLRRASLVILTRSQAQPEKTRRVERWLQAKLACPILRAEIRPRELVSLDGKTRLPLGALAGKRVAAFCGLADPVQFFRTLEQAGAGLVFTKVFPDHHPYRPHELAELVRSASRRGAEMLVTTQKDAVKIPPTGNWENQSLYYLTIRIEVSGGEELLEKALRKVLRG